MFLLMPDEWTTTITPTTRGRRKLREQPHPDSPVVFTYIERFRPFPNRAKVLESTAKAMREVLGERFVITRLRDGLRIRAEITRGEALGFLAGEFMRAGPLADLTLGRIFDAVIGHAVGSHL